MEEPGEVGVESCFVRYRTTKKGKIWQKGRASRVTTTRCYGEGKFSRIGDNEKVERLNWRGWTIFSIDWLNEIQRACERDRVRRVLVESGRDAAGAAGVGQRDPTVGQRGDTALRFSARKLWLSKLEKRIRVERRRSRNGGDRC